MKKNALWCKDWGSSYNVDTDRVEYFLPSGFEKLLAELARIQWVEELKGLAYKRPE